MPDACDNPAPPVGAGFSPPGSCADIAGVQERLIKLRYAGWCALCGAALDVGTPALWDVATRTTCCVACAEPPGGAAGASAAETYWRRRAHYERAVRSNHPRMGGVMLALKPEPQRVQAWSKGADGERALGRRLDKLAARGIEVLHDRKLPGSRANIDHVVVASSGVWIVDTKNYSGKVERRRAGREWRLFVGGRDRTKLVEGMSWQLDAVRGAIEEHHVPVHAVVCFVSGEWPLFSKPMVIGATIVTWPRALETMIVRPGPLGADERGTVLRAIGRAFPRR